MLVVVSLIMILIALIVPGLREVRRGAMGGVCVSNMHQIRQSMYGIKGIHQHQGIPSAGTWVGAVGSQGGADALVCPLDEDVFSASGGQSGFDDMVLVQWDHSGHPDNGHITETTIPDIIAGGSLNDPQVSWFRNDGLHRGSQLNGEAEFMSAVGVSDWSELPDGVIAVSVDWSGRFTIDLNNRIIKVYHKWTGDPQGGGSRHFIYDANGEVAEIGGGRHTHTNGTAHQGYDPPLEIPANGSAVSYGMNSQIVPKQLRGDQILLLDYEKSIVEVGADGYAIDDFDEFFAPRHSGRAHVMFVDDRIESLSQAELEVDQEPWVADPSVLTP